MSEPAIAEKLTLVSQVQRNVGCAPWFLETPILIHAGDRYWLDEDAQALLVEGASGTTQAHPFRFASGPDALR